MERLAGRSSINYLLQAGDFMIDRMSPELSLPFPSAAT
jgi:hypothetical protein